MFYLGIDVAKAKLDCCLLLDPESTKRKSKSVANTRAGFATLLEWLARNGVSPAQLHAVMEGTGVYHEQAALALADTGVTVSIVNPAQIRDFARGLAVRTKTDGVDSFVLARYGALLKPQPWQPPSAEARVLRALLARREAVAQDLQRELNRREKADATQTPALIRQSIDDSSAFLRKQLAKLQEDIDHHIDRHPNLKDDMELLTAYSVRIRPPIPFQAGRVFRGKRPLIPEEFGHPVEGVAARDNDWYLHSFFRGGQDAGGEVIHAQDLRNTAVKVWPRAEQSRGGPECVGKPEHGGGLPAACPGCGSFLAVT